MKIKYEITLDDMVAFNLDHAALSPTIKRTLLIWRWAGALGVFLIIACSKRELSLPFHLFLSSLGALTFAWYYPRAYRGRVKRLTRKLYKEGDNKGIIGPHELEATEEGLISKSVYSESKISWAMLKKIESNSDRSYLYTSAMSAIVIPHDRITSGDFWAFMTEIGKRYDPDKKLANSTSAATLIQ